jgi:hypothetical protein
MMKVRVIDLITLGAVVGGFGFLLHAANQTLKLPDVYVSYSTGDCDYVINYDDDNIFSCDNLPAKYIHHWSE